MRLSSALPPLEVARRAAKELAARGVPDAGLDAQLLLAEAMGLPRIELFTRFDLAVDDATLERFRGYVERRARREPLQYITGSVAFREIELRVDGRALIPRPETEVLVGVVLDWAQRRVRAGRAPRRVLDVGTGSGAIALALLAERGFEHATATDPSPDALALAGENAAALGLTQRVALRRGPLYEPVREERFDAIVSNPPYIAAGERDTLAPEVAQWEPEGALFAGARGLEVVEPIVRGAMERLERPGLLALELAPWQTEEVAALARECGFAAVRVAEDLAGRQRIVAAESD